MRILNLFAAACLVAAPALLTPRTAEALTARQYQAQGHGIYLNSTGSRASRWIYHRHHHRALRHRDRMR